MELINNLNSETNSILSRQEAISIYRNTFIGRRIAEALPNYAMSTPRQIQVVDAPSEVAEEFVRTAEKYKQDAAIRLTTIYARVFGIAGLYIATRKKDNNTGYTKELDESYNEYLDWDNIADYDIRFNPVDCLAMSGTIISQEPLSVEYLNPFKIFVAGKEIRRERIEIVYSSEPIYLNNESTLIPFAPPSVYKNMLKLIYDYERGLEDLSYILRKAGSIVLKYKHGSKIDGVAINSVIATAKLVQQMQTGNVIAIPNDNELDNWSSKDINNICDGLAKIEHSIIQALNDTPAPIFQDRQISNGLSEGKEEMKAVLMAIDIFRKNWLDRLYKHTDPVIMMKAWTPEFIEDIKSKYDTYKDKSVSEIRHLWKDGFIARFGDPYPETESSKAKALAYQINTLQKLSDMGVSQESISKEVNESKYFKNKMEFEQLPLQRATLALEAQNQQIAAKQRSQSMNKYNKGGKAADTNTKGSIAEIGRQEPLYTGENPDQALQALEVRNS